MGDLVMRLVKYVLEGVAVAVAAFVLPGKTLKVPGGCDDRPDGGGDLRDP
jgi:hypothetical protein